MRSSSHQSIWTLCNMGHWVIQMICMFGWFHYNVLLDCLLSFCCEFYLSESRWDLIIRTFGLDLFLIEIYGILIQIAHYVLLCWCCGGRNLTYGSHDLPWWCPWLRLRSQSRRRHCRFAQPANPCKFLPPPFEDSMSPTQKASSMDFNENGICDNWVSREHPLQICALFKRYKEAIWMHA